MRLRKSKIGWKLESVMFWKLMVKGVYRWRWWLFVLKVIEMLNIMNMEIRMRRICCSYI